MKRMKRNLKRALSLVLALALVLGMTSVSVLADDDTTESTTTTTESVELEADGAVTYTVDGDLTSEDTSSINTSVATVSITKKSVTADGGSYYLQYTRGDYTYYLTFSADSSGTLSIGTVTSYSSATPVIYGTDSSLSFTSGDTTYYLNNTTGTALTADSTASTTWSYSTTAGFYCTVNSIAYYLGSFAGYVTSSTSPGSAAPSGSTMIAYDVYGSGVYTLSYDSDTYLSLSYSDSALSVSAADSADDATAVTFDGSNLYFTYSEETYYLDINSGTLIAQPSSSRTSSYKAAWIYDPDYGFYCMKNSVLYYIVLTYDSSSASYSLGLSTSPDLSDGQSRPALNATTDLSFRLKCNGYYLALSGSTNALTTLSVTSRGGTVFYYTTDGHLYFTDNDTKYYLVVAEEANLSVTTAAGEATEVAFKLANGSAWTYGFSFAYTDSGGTTSDTMYLSGSPVLASSEQTTITFTGVAAGTTSVTIGGVTYEITVYTDIITLYVGDTYVAGVEGSYTSSDLSGLDTTIATADFDETTVGYTNATVSADGTTAYILGYKTGGVKYYFTLDYSGGSLVTGTVLNYYDGTSVLFESDGSTSSDGTITGYLKFTASDGTTTYYLNVDTSGALTASTDKSTVWTYDDTNGFTCSYTDSDSTTSTLYLLDLLAVTNPGGTHLLPNYTITSSSYVLQYTETTTSEDDASTTVSTTYYLTFSVSNDTLTVGTATDSSSSGTAVTYTTDGYLTFASDSTTYYLYVTSDGSLSATSDESSAAAWSYSPTEGFFCMVGTSTYYLSGSSVSTSSGTSTVTFTATTDFSFSLGYSDENLTYYVQFSSSSPYAVSSLTTTSGTGDAYKVTYTSAGYLKNNGSYLNVEDGKLVTSSTASTAWTYDPANGFYCTVDEVTYYLTDFLAFTSNTSSTAVCAYGKTTGTVATAITFTGVSAGTTTATLSSSDTESSTSYIYKIIVLDEPEYVTYETSPFVGSAVTTSTYNNSAYSTVTTVGYTGYPVTGIYLSLGLNYAVTLNTDDGTSSDSVSNGVVISSGGTWTIADGSVATFVNGSTTLTDTEGTAVTITGVAAGETSLTYTTTDGTSYTIPITIKDFWGYASASSTTIKVYEFYVAEITSTTTYMAVLYGKDNDSVSNEDFLEVAQGEVVYISFPYYAGTAVDYFGTPDDGYALTLLGSTNSASHYMALDSDNPGETEFASLTTAAGYNQIYYYGSASVFNVIQAALDYDSDGGMGFTRQATSYGNVSSMVTVRSQKLPTVDKEIATITRTSTDGDGNTTTSTINYTEGMVIQEGDVINYTVSITQYATTEAITYTNELLSDSLRVKIYLVYTIDSDGKVEGSSTTEADEATAVTFTASGNDANTGYLAATIDDTVYYLYLNSSAQLCGTTTQSDAGTWTYNLGTGLSYTITGTDSTSTIYYLAGSAITTTSGTNVVAILQRDNDSYVLGYSGIETYLTYSWDSDSEKLTVGTASATTDSDNNVTTAVYDNATGMTFSGGYLSFTQGSTEYYLTVSVDGSTGSLTATSTQTEAATWEYSASTGFSCTASDLTWYLSSTGVQSTPPSHVILCRLRDANTAVLGYGSRSSTLTMSVTTGETTSSATKYQVSETDSSSDAEATLSNLNLANTTLSEDKTYTYTVSYTVQKSDVDLLLTNTVSLSYSYQSEYSSNVQAVATAASASVTILSFSMDDIVIDYGLPVDMDYATDCSNHSITLTEEGAEAEHGTISVENNVVTYTLTEPLSEADTVNVYNTGGGYYTFHVYPATQMYYEEDFGSTVAVGDDATEHALIQYSSGSNSGSWSTVYQKVTETTTESKTDGVTTTTTTTSVDNTDYELTSDSDYSLYRFTQETGVVGVNTDSDTTNDVSIYGSDESYLSNQYDSEYHSEKADVTSNPAAFRYYFTGTGTTIYSRTSEDSAYISVKLTYMGDDEVTYTNTSGTEVKLNNGENADTWYIDTRNVADISGTTDSAIYGDSTDDATLYNIPVYDITDLPYGEWKVYVYVYPKGTEVNYIYNKSMTKCCFTGYYAYVKSGYDVDGNALTAGYYEIYTDGSGLYIKSTSSSKDYGIPISFGSTGTETTTTTSEDSTTSTTTKYRVYNASTSTDENDNTVTTYTETWVESSVLLSMDTSVNVNVSTTATELYLPVENSNQSGSVFYLDGVRVYDPAGTQTSDNTASGYIDSDIYKAYTSDGENDPVVLNISDALFSSSSFATLTDVEGNIAETSTYTSIGPDNEVYLYNSSDTTSSTQTATTVSFYILNWNSSYKIYLGMKSPNGTAAKVKVGSSDEITLSNSVDCYYNITSYLTTVSDVTIYNSSNEDITSSVGTIKKVTVTVTNGLASLTNIKVIGASSYTIADSDSYSDTNTSGASVSSLTFASIDSDWIVVAGEEDDSSGDDTSGNGSSGTDEDTNDSDNTDDTDDTGNTTDTSDSDTSDSDSGETGDVTDTSGSGSGETGDTTGTPDTELSDSGSQDAGDSADDTDTGSSGTQDSDGGSGGVNDADSSTQNTASAALQIKSVKATYKNGKTTLKVTTSSSVKTLKVAGKSAKLTKTGKNKNVFTVKLNKDRRGKAVKMVMKSSTGKKKTKRILIPKKLKATAKYKAKTKKVTVTIKTSKEVTKVKVNGKKAKRKKTKNGYTYTITLKKKKGSTVNVVGYNKKKAATVTYSVKVK